MYECFTDQARKVMQLANRETRQYDCGYIGTEHVLLGLVKEGSGVAANVLKNLDIDLRMIRLEVENLVFPQSYDSELVVRPHTFEVESLLNAAVEEARVLNHNYVGTEHLLLGLLRTREGNASKVLTVLGLSPELVREEVLNLLGHGPLRGLRQVKKIWKDSDQVLRFLLTGTRYTTADIPKNVELEVHDNSANRQFLFILRHNSFPVVTSASDEGEPDTTVSGNDLGGEG